MSQSHPQADGDSENGRTHEIKQVSHIEKCPTYELPHWRRVSKYPWRWWDIFFLGRLGTRGGFAVIIPDQAVVSPK
jgi:hypothetical protein